MNSYKITLSYNGFAYSGFQIQPNCKTVEFDIRQAIHLVFKGDFFDLTYSGRTDSGVHAIGQVLSFRSNTYIPWKSLKLALNAALSCHLSVDDCFHVNHSFHARFSALSRHYKFLFTDQPVPLFLKDRLLFIPYTLNVQDFDSMRSLLIGYHDFSMFCKQTVEGTNYFRHIYKLSLEKKFSQNIYNCRDVLYYYELSVVGNGFLYNMVRNLLGAMMRVFIKKETIDSFEQFVKTHDKNRFFFSTLDPVGLCLYKVNY